MTKAKKNKTYICVNLGFFSGISSCERQHFDMMIVVIVLQLADVSVKKLQN